MKNIIDFTIGVVAVYILMLCACLICLGLLTILYKFTGMGRITGKLLIAFIRYLMFKL